MTQPSLPNLFIAGAPKSGTSSLHRWICDHPDAVGPREKETYFFVDSGTHMFRPEAHVSGGLDALRDQFRIPKGTAPRVIVESTPAHMYYRTALSEIPELESRPKCLFVLREPATQIYSLYSYFCNNWDWVPASMSFPDFLDAVREDSCDFKGNELARNALSYARYVDHLLPWRERLGADRMLVMTFDDLARDPAGCTMRIATWLDLDPRFYETYGFLHENETYAPRSRMLQRLNIIMRGSLPKDGMYDRLRSVYRKLNTKRPAASNETVRNAIAMLRREFAKDNRRLERAFGLDLRHWSGEPQ